MSHQQINKAEAAVINATERDAKTAYQAAYAESLRQYEQDDDHAAFTARNQAAAATLKAATAPGWARREAVLNRIDED